MDQIAVIRPGMTIHLGKVSVRVYQGRHVRFDRKLIFRSLRPLRILKYIRNLPFLIYAVTHFPENHETVVYELMAEGKTVLLLGSMELDEKEEYTKGADLLILPFQGRSEPEKKADELLERLQPSRVLLSHYDDAFPPISKSVDTRGLKHLLNTKYPAIRAVKPKAGKTIEI